MHPVITDLINTQYGFHCLIVAAVLTCAVLVYVFGFKSAVEPPFDKLSYSNAEDRKPGAGKKKKPKDKKAQSNGHATAVGGETKKSEQKSSKKDDKLEKSPSKEGNKNLKEEKKSPAKNALRETKGSNKDVKKAAGGDAGANKARQQSKGKENVEQVKNKKNQVEEKPKDFDDGEWEQALSRKDKKNRKATLDEIISKDKKRDGKKKNKGGEDSGVVDSSGESDARGSDESKEKSQVLEALAEIGLSTTEVETPVVEASKPKKAKKKKPAEQVQTSTPEVVTPVDEKKIVIDEPEIITDPEPPAEPKPPRAPKKQEPPPSEETVSEPVVAATSDTPVASNVAFDELGDAWKEAKAPKKTTKKKSRKD